MAASKTRKREPKNPPDQPVRQEELTPQGSGRGRSGQGALSAMEYLIEQEKARARKSDNG